MRRRLGALVLVVSAAVAGCAAPSGSATPGSTATPGVSGTPASTVTPDASAPRELTVAPGTELVPGSYTRSGFVPPVSFEVGAGWYAVQAVAGFFDVQRDPRTLDVIAVQFARPSDFDTAAAAAAAIRSAPGLSVSDPLEVSVGGLAGTQLLAESTNHDLDAQVFVAVFSVPAGPISIGSGRRLQVTLLDTPDGLLAILVGGSEREWDATVEAAAPVLASIRIGEGG